MVSSEFQDAVEQCARLNGKPGKDEMLELYSYYKQAKQDPPFEKSKAPGMMDIKGQFKQKAWKKVVEEGVTPEEADAKYIQTVEKLKAKYGYDANKQATYIGGAGD